MKKNNIKAEQFKSILDSKCTGCLACYNACESNAISTIYNKEGFITPKINLQECTDCGRCVNVCPILNKVSTLNSDYLKCYIGCTKDNELKSKSSSGGVFGMLAQYILKHDGYVCGAAMNDNSELNHHIINNINFLNPLLGSKYLQSNVDNIYKTIKKLLLKNKTVLFCGTPCQVGGLKSYLAKNYNNLITIDFICHGVPSPKVFNYYNSYISQKHNSKISEVIFKDKTHSWKKYNITFKSKSKEIIHSTYFKKDIYMQAFLKNLILRESCYNCQFKDNYQSDLTLGDFWGAEKYYPNLDDDTGLSLIISHNSNGDNILEHISNQFKIIEETNIKYCIEKNSCITKSVPPHKNRTNFFNELSTKEEKEIKKLLEKNLKMSINDYFHKKITKIKRRYGK